MTVSREAIQRLAEELSRADRANVGMAKIHRSDLRDMLDMAAKLPVTADGVVKTPQETVWANDPDGGLQERRIEWRHNPRSRAGRKNGWWTRKIYGTDEWTEMKVAECYSTEAAARLANGPHDHDHLEGD